MSDLFKELKYRGAIYQIAGDITSLKSPINLYLGIDPTGKSLHLGHLVGLVVALIFLKHNHNVHILIGGATALIGDPSGKDKERPLLTREAMEENCRELEVFLTQFFKRNGEKQPIFLNNYQWFKDMSCIDFLRNLGKDFRMGQMLGKHSIRSRIDSPEGISFTESSYQILQSYDFFHLYKNRNVTLQIGGSDQYGNMVSGIDYIRKKINVSVCSLTFPLLTKSDGKKLGKSEKGTIWLDNKLLSSQDFYQYLYGTSDKDVIQLVKLITLIKKEKIDRLESEMGLSDYVKNRAQEILATEVTKMVHGNKAVEVAKSLSKLIGKNAPSNLQDMIDNNLFHKKMRREDVVGESYLNLLLKSGLVNSKSAGIRLIKGNGAYLNYNAVKDQFLVVTEELLLQERFVVLGCGKKTYLLIYVV